jgi:uncharacterized protein
VKISVYDIKAEAKELAYDEPTDELNALMAHGAHDFDLPAPLHVTLVHYRAGQELIFQGTLRGKVVGHCARCLDEFTLEVERPFHCVLVPHSDVPAEVELEEDDLDLSYYSGDEVDVSPLIREQLLLSLPTQPLCHEACRGLCPKCGANRNRETCACPADFSDPRLAVLHGLKASH